MGARNQRAGWIVRSTPNQICCAALIATFWLTSPSHASTQPEATQRIPLKSWRIWHAFPRSTEPGYFAYVADPKGFIYRVEEGDRLGTEYGRIVHISSCQLDLVELKTDGKGGWLEVPTTLRQRDCEEREELGEFRLSELVLIGTRKGRNDEWVACFAVAGRKKVFEAHTNEWMARMLGRITIIDKTSVTITLQVNGDESTKTSFRWPIATAGKLHGRKCP
jgi:Tfp pilus assembly protein PilP